MEIRQTIFSKVSFLPEFEKDLKKLSKRFRTLPDDLNIFVKAQLNLFHKIKEDNRGIVRIPDLGFESPQVFKARKFACRALKGRGINSGIRVVYAYFEEEDWVEFIEIYFKGDQGNEDQERIFNHYRKL